MITVRPALAVGEEDLGGVIVDLRIADGTTRIIDQVSHRARAHVQLGQLGAVLGMEPDGGVVAGVAEVSVVMTLIVPAMPTLGEDDLVDTKFLQPRYCGLLLSQLGFDPFLLDPITSKFGLAHRLDPIGCVVMGLDLVFRKGPVPDRDLIDIAVELAAAAGNAGRIPDPHRIVQCPDRSIERGAAGLASVEIDSQLAARRIFFIAPRNADNVLQLIGYDRAPFAKDVLPIALAVVETDPSVVQRKMVGIVRHYAPLQHEPVPTADLRGMDPGLDCVIGPKLQVAGACCGQILRITSKNAQCHGSVKCPWYRVCIDKSQVSTLRAQVVFGIAGPVLHCAAEIPVGDQTFCSRWLTCPHLSTSSQEHGGHDHHCHCWTR